jgi:hypothetical protein
MLSFSIEQAIAIAKAHNHARRLGEAEAIYRQVLAQSPDHANALSQLGVLAIQTSPPGMVYAFKARGSEATVYRVDQKKPYPNRRRR